MKIFSSCIYGPVNSWRMGKSLGVDLLCVDSICSFDCVYCQLGKINCLTVEREVFVTTAKILEELKNCNWREADVITFSGIGEPTLAANLGEAIRAVKKWTGKPVAVLTNSTLFFSKKVRNREDLTGVRVVRGGSWYSAGNALLYIPYRDHFLPEISHHDLGFRVIVRPLP